jgi:hypothetical protein
VLLPLSNALPSHHPGARRHALGSIAAIDDDDCAGYTKAAHH